MCIYFVVIRKAVSVRIGVGRVSTVCDNLLTIPKSISICVLNDRVCTPYRLVNIRKTVKVGIGYPPAAWRAAITSPGVLTSLPRPQ